ncbi:hypothetical protein, partial [Archangium sp.]|uniref:hypothetical protein n=1 Tax=Archangium sp. TaxID=1872627 RepID=UPI00286B678E
MLRTLHALLVASCLAAGPSAVGGEPRRERVMLSVRAPPREEALRQEDWPEGAVLSLRVVDPGRLRVKAGAHVLAASELGWGEDERLRLEPLEDSPSEALPRVVNREPGREEVEVHVPAGVDAGAPLTLTYEWDWKHAGRPALVRTWRLPALEPDVPPEWLEDEPSEQEEAPEEEAEVLAFLSTRAAPLPVQVDPERPELLWVPGHASREELAARLLGDVSKVDAFDVEPRQAPPDAEGRPRLCVRVRQPEALVPEVLAALRGALEARLAADVAAEALVERGPRWSQHSHLLDGSGQSYFDRYLQALSARDERLLTEAPEPLHKAIALRSKRWKTGYRVTDGSPVLAPGDVVGRFHFPDGASVQVHVLVPLVEERSLERAEVRVRNLPRASPRVLLPGEDGRWRGYSVDFGLAAGAPEPLEHPEGDFSWYYPGTLLLRPGDWRVGRDGGTGELAA